MSSGLSHAGGSVAAKTIVYRRTNDLAVSKTNPWKFAKSLSPTRKQPPSERTVPKSPTPGTTGGRPPSAMKSIPTHARTRSRSTSPRKQPKIRSRNSMSLPRSPLMDDSEASKQSSHCLVGAPKQTGKGGKVTQSQRLIRILLNDNTLTVSKATVDRALQKHTELLKRLQHTNETAKTSIDMLETKLDISGVELEIAKTERNNIENKVKTLRWKLAKERTIAKEKLAAAAASILAPTAAAVVRDKDVCLEQLMSRSEHRHDFGEICVDSQTFTAKGQAADRSDDTNSASDSTPIMGQSFSTVTRNDTSQLQARIAALEDEKIEMTEDFEETLEEAQSKMAHLKNVLIACNERRRLAEGRLNELGESTNELTQISQVQPEELVGDIIREKVAKVTGDNSKVIAKLKEETKRKQELELDLKTTIEDNLQLKSEVSSLTIHVATMGSALTQFKDSEAEAISKVGQAETALRISKNEIVVFESKCTELEESLVLARKQLAESAASAEKIEDAHQRSQKQFPPDCIHQSNQSGANNYESESSRAVLVENSTLCRQESESGQFRMRERFEDRPAAPIRDLAGEHLDRALKAEELLRTAEMKLEECLSQLEEAKKQTAKTATSSSTSTGQKKSERMRETRSALRKAEAKMEEVRARVFSTHKRSVSSSLKSRIALLENISSKSTSGHMKSPSSMASIDQAGDDGPSTVQVAEFSEKQGAALEVSKEEAPAKLREFSTNPKTSEKEETTLEDTHFFELDMESRVSSEDLSPEETRETLLQTIEDVKKLRKKIAVSETQLNEANGKLVFLRKVVLSVVSEEQELFLCDETSRHDVNASKDEEGM